MDGEEAEKYATQGKAIEGLRWNLASQRRAARMITASTLNMSAKSRQKIATSLPSRFGATGKRLCPKASQQWLRLGSVQIS
jgi:hypothetical protein